jgi:hypothetical protein
MSSCSCCLQRPDGALSFVAARSPQASRVDRGQDNPAAMAPSTTDGKRIASLEPAPSARHRPPFPTWPRRPVHRMPHRSATHPSARQRLGLAGSQPPDPTYRPELVPAPPWQPAPRPKQSPVPPRFRPWTKICSSAFPPFVLSAYNANGRIRFAGCTEATGDSIATAARPGHLPFRLLRTGSTAACCPSGMPSPASPAVRGTPAPASRSPPPPPAAAPQAPR